MKKAMVVIVFCLMGFWVNGQFLIHKVIKNQKENQKKEETGCPPLDSAVYKTNRFVKYAVLPAEIKVLMASLGCGRFDAAPDQKNDVKNNIDYGYSIDLNDDWIPEYIFCCTQGPHGPCNANLFAQVHGSWKLIMTGFDGFSNEDPTVNIKVLKTIHEGFHDLYQNDRILVFKNGRYDISVEK